MLGFCVFILLTGAGLFYWGWWNTDGWPSWVMFGVGLFMVLCAMGVNAVRVEENRYYTRRMR